MWIVCIIKYCYIAYVFMISSLHRVLILSFLMQHVDCCDNLQCALMLSIFRIFPKMGLKGFVVYSFDSMHSRVLCDNLYFNTLVH